MRLDSKTLMGLSLVLVAATAWGQAPTDSPSTRRGPQFYARGGSTQPAATPKKEIPGIKNYHRQLFGTDAPVQTTAPSPRDNAVQPAGFTRRAADTKPNRVVNAQFQKPNAGNANPIQRVSGTRDTKPTRLTITPVVGGPQAAVVGPQSPALTLEWVKQTDVNVGQECEVHLVVKNSGQVTAHDVVVEAHFPRTIRMVKTEPEAAENRESLSWSFPKLAQEEEKKIRLVFVPSKRGELATRAHVRFTGAAATVFDVEEPLLKVAVSGPASVRIGEPASQIVTVSNPGTGIARNVVLEARLPAGLEHPRGKKLVTDIGPLNAGESRQIRLALAAVAGGAQILKVAAQADGNLVQATEATVDVIAPSLDIKVAGPKLRYLGRAAQYVLTVTNDGSGPTDNVRVVHQVPKGFTYDSSDRGGKFSRTSKRINWFVGRLAPGEQVKLACKLVPSETGKFEHRVGAVSEQGATAEANATTVVDATAELVLEIVDLDDPVEVGVETGYEIRVRNDGSKAASNVGVSCELPQGVTLVSARGPAPHVADGGVLVFKSIGALEPGKTALYRIVVKGTSSGNHRFRARLASESITEPLINEEITKFYGE